ncbi:hypothetical protein ASG94_15175 [Nocardioides sp. Soil805]|nr:hypothetical protein ASG94_15175 [Nocardioides sp. Soil805]
MVNERGRISQSTSALGTLATDGSIRVDKPEGATVRSAWMAYATAGFSGAQVTGGYEPVLNGTPVPITHEILNGIGSYNYFAEVTDIVKPVVDAAGAGTVQIPLAEPDAYLLEGEMLVVVFDDPAVQEDQSVSLMYGGLSPGGDQYQVKLAEPIDLRDPRTRLEMSLGITFSYQEDGSQQYSSVLVNGMDQLTTSAGGEDDGQSRNGALITVGGLGDAIDNPADPLAYPTDPRSDDELYDLRPFVENGDRTIYVGTSNPSLDDNVMLATFTMNPPVTDIKGDSELVMLSFGDSYQSGEGAGSAYDDIGAYIANAYENGSNFPDAIGGSQDTLSPALTGGNGCHRALANYPKQVADWLRDDFSVRLVDLTCSGAKIEPGGKPPIVGDLATGDVDSDSQITDAIARLGTEGLERTDVDLVTVGMGGNDAKFSSLVTACIAPTLVRRILAAYDRTPWLLNQAAKLLTCKRIDERFMHVGDAIDGLADKQRFAQRELRNAFPNADIFQVDYPGVLPDPDSAPSWCGGIGADDIAYADAMAGRITDVISTTVAEKGQIDAGLDRYYAPVEVSRAFGANALCPADPADALTNGIDEATFQAEAERLTHDPEVEPLVDEVLDAAASLRNCLARLTIGCDPQARTDRLTAALQAVQAKFTEPGFGDEILANIVKSPSSGETVEQRLDRSVGLFHPNQAGIDVLACYVHNTATFLGTSFCPNGGAGLRAGFAATDEPPVDLPTAAITATRVPIPVAGTGASVSLALSGYAPGSTVAVERYGSPVATLPVGADGKVTGPLVLPAADPGVQVFEVRGQTAGGAALGHDLRLTYPGSPTVNQDYTFYVDGFESSLPADPTRYDPEDVVLRILGTTAALTYHADPQGGLLVTLPMPEAWPAGGYEVTLTGSRSGVVRSARLDPEQAIEVGGLWASADDLQITGAEAQVRLLVHGERSVRLGSANGRYTGGVEYVADLNAHRSAVIDPAPLKVPEGEKTPPVLTVSSYRPGGTEAVAAGATYTAVSPAACVNGTWTPKATDLTGVVYVPCSVLVSGTGLSASVTLAAEGSVKVEAPAAVLKPAARSGAVVVAGGGLHVAGDNIRVQGPLFSGAGIRLTGSTQTLFCGAVGRSVTVSGSRFVLERGGPCAPS